MNRWILMFWLHINSNWKKSKKERLPTKVADAQPSVERNQ